MLHITKQWLGLLSKQARLARRGNQRCSPSPPGSGARAAHQAACGCSRAGGLGIEGRSPALARRHRASSHMLQTVQLEARIFAKGSEPPASPK